jgi:hypothetical protein
MKTKYQILFQGQDEPLFKKFDSQIINSIIIRSTAMKHTQIFQRAAIVALAIILMATVAFAGNAIINGTMNNTGTLVIKNALSGTFKNFNGTVEFGSAGNQSIPSGYQFEKLVCSTGGDKTFAGTVTITDYVKADAAAVKVSTYKLVDNSANANSIQVAAGGSFDFTSGEVEYAYNGAQTVYGGTTYKNLTIGTGGDKTTNADIQVTGALVVNDNLVMSGTSVLIMKNGASQPTFSGLKEVKGNMTWEAYLAQAYTFNNSSTVMTFSGADGTRTFTLKSQPGVNPNGYTAGHTVNRTFNVSYTNWNTGTVDLQLAYLQGEGSGLGVTETKLRNFKDSIASTKKLGGTFANRTSSTGSTFGYSKYTGYTSAQLVTSSMIAMDDRFGTYTSIANAIWNLGTTWDDGVVPGASDDATINSAVTIQDGGSYSVNSVTINSGAAIALQVGGTSTGTLNVGTGGLTNNNALNAAALDVRANGVVEISGVFNNDGGITNAGRITVQ